MGIAQDGGAWCGGGASDDVLSPPAAARPLCARASIGRVCACASAVFGSFALVVVWRQLCIPGARDGKRVECWGSGGFVLVPWGAACSICICICNGSGATADFAIVCVYVRRTVMEVFPRRRRAADSFVTLALGLGAPHSGAILLSLPFSSAFPIPLFSTTSRSRGYHSGRAIATATSTDSKRRSIDGRNAG